MEARSDLLTDSACVEPAAVCVNRMRGAIVEELFAIPDFIPSAWEAEYLEQARLQVLTTCHERQLAQPDPGLQGAATNGWLATWRTGLALSWLPAGEAALAAITLLCGWAGLVALTGMWLWLAVTHDLIWWWFTTLGGILTVLLPSMGVRLQRRCHHTRMSAAATEKANGRRADVASRNVAIAQRR